MSENTQQEPIAPPSLDKPEDSAETRPLGALFTKPAPPVPGRTRWSMETW